MTVRDCWFVGAILVALGRQPMPVRARPFLPADLLAWCPELGKHSRSTMLAHMASLGLVEKAEGYKGSARACYRLTRAGLKAAADAVLADARNARAASDPFARRLWALLRARGRLTAPQAVDTLADAGQEGVEALRKRAAELLRAWSIVHPQAVKVSVRPEAGARCYVLLQDLGPAVPAVTAPPAASPAASRLRDPDRSAARRAKLEGSVAR